MTSSARIVESHTALPSHANSNLDSSRITHGMEASALLITFISSIGRVAIPCFGPPLALPVFSLDATRHDQLASRKNDWIYSAWSTVSLSVHKTLRIFGWANEARQKQPSLPIGWEPARSLPRGSDHHPPSARCRVSRKLCKHHG